MEIFWIGTKEKPKTSGLYIFRKEVEFEKGDHVVFRLSADTRYEFFLNGERVCEGPCQSGGDVWYYEEQDVSSRVKAGRNLLEVKVWHIVTAPMEFTFTSALHSTRPALWAEWVVTRGENTLLFGTDDSWQLYQEISYTFPKYINFVPPCESDGVKRLEKLDCAIVRKTERFEPYTRYGYTELYPLKKRPIPDLCRGEAKTLTLLKSGETWSEWDAGTYVTAKLRFSLKSKARTTVKIYYNECYWQRDGEGKLYKGVRDDEQGVLTCECHDTVEMEAGEKVFEPIWWRPFRYIRIESDASVAVDAVFYEFTYPLAVTGGFRAENAEYNRIFDVSVRTLKNCMHEIFVDCPYYEQQQYCMDTALEALFSMSISSDYRLVQKSIYDLAASQGTDGFLAANWPSSGPRQVIPTFSVFWIMLLRDYAQYSGDLETVKELFGVVNKILDGFEKYLDENGVLQKTPCWEFLDWVPEWSFRGYPHAGETRPLAVYSMMYAYGLGLARELSLAIGKTWLAKDFEERKNRVNSGIRAVYYDENCGLYIDTAEGGYSLHTAIWAVLCDAETDGAAQELLERALEKSLPQTSFSMTYFVFRALEKTGLYQRYFLRFLGGWKKMLALHCEVWCENAEKPRSECHGWSATPIYEYVSAVAGLKPVGFDGKHVLIEPKPIAEVGDFTASLPIDSGVVELQYAVLGDSAKIKVTAPKGVLLTLRLPDGKEWTKEGEIVWKGNRI